MAHIDPKVESKLRKLLALAEQGVGGEKTTAKRMLNKMLDKHGLTPDNLVKESEQDYWIRYQPGGNDKQLLIQVISRVLGYDVQLWTRKNKQRQVGFECTEYELMEIELHYSIYSKALKKELDIAYNAFISVNEIYATNWPKSETQREATEKDMKIWRRANQMDVTPVNLALENKSK